MIRKNCDGFARRDCLQLGLGALMAGMLVPFLGLYSASLLNTKVSNRREVEAVFVAACRSGVCAVVVRSNDAADRR